MPTSDSLAVEILADPGRTHSTVVLRGRFTFAAHAAFRDLLSLEAERITGGGTLAFDLSAVEFIDSAALGMLLLAREAARQKACRIVLRGATGQVRRMLSVSKFETMFLVEP